jgi:hypothetical protein
MHTIKILAPIVASLLLAQAHIATAKSAEAAPLALPQVTGPIAVTRDTRPFLGAQAAIESAGYVEDEYFLTG